MEKDKSTEQRILDAARQVFMAKGLAGSRMQEIADQAGINKAMLHYYFRNKDQLFNAIFAEAAGKIMPRLHEIIHSNTPLFEKIEQFTDHYITTILANPLMPAFVLNELNQNPEQLANKLFGSMKPDTTPLLKQINEEIAAGKIRPVAPIQLVVNIMALCVFPFVGKPLLKEVMGIPDEMYTQFLESRKQHVAQFVINAIKL